MSVTGKTKPEIPGEAFSRKEIMERLEHYRLLLVRTKAGERTDVRLSKVWEYLDHWLDELLALKGR